MFSATKPSAADPTDLATIAVVGALRSGTNYLKYLIENNYYLSASFSPFGWKHGSIPILAKGSTSTYPDMPLAFIVKNPYAFALSLHRYHMRKVTNNDRISIDAQTDFDAFLRQPITIYDSQLTHSPQMRFPNPVQYWNFFYWNLGTLNAKRFKTISFRYEDLVRDPENLRAIEQVLVAKRRSDTIVAPENKLRRLSEITDTGPQASHESADSFDPEYYTKRRYLDAYTEPQLAFINTQAEPQLMQQFSYDFA